MAKIAISKDFGRNICLALNEDPNLVRKITIIIEKDSAMIVEFEKYATDEQVMALGHVFQDIEKREDIDAKS